MLTRLLFVTLTLLSSIAVSQTMSVSQHFKPGDTIRYYVRFDGNAEIEKVSLIFQLSSPLHKGQDGLNQSFGIDATTKTAPGVFEVSGRIPDAATGTFQLIQIGAVHTPESHTYRYQQDFSDKIAIEIVNDSSFHFPDIKSITPEPPK